MSTTFLPWDNSHTCIAAGARDTCSGAGDGTANRRSAHVSFPECSLLRILIRGKDRPQTCGPRTERKPEERHNVRDTKDRDFVQLMERHGAPPCVLWLTCGNTSNARLREILSVALGDALALVATGERLVEISGA